MKSAFLVALLCGISAVIASGNDYDGYQVIRLQLKTDYQYIEMMKLSKKLKLDFWKEGSLTMPTDVMASPTTKENVIQFAKDNDIEYYIYVKNVGKAIEKNLNENKRAQLLAEKKRYSNSITYFFPLHSQINDWIDEMASSHPFVSVASIGFSYERRDMKILKIGAGSNKPILLIDAGIHAREWLGPASLIYLTNKLIDQYNAGDQLARSIVDKFEIHVLPVVNPDGYDYSHQSNNTRLWRKTRKPYGACYGADPNRNFDSSFAGPGTSNDSCSDIYHGPSAFSEPETANVKDHIMGQNQRVKVYMTTHAYGQFWFIPYGYTKKKPRCYDELMRVAKIGKEALRRTNGLNFTIGSPAQVMYEASGNNIDWSYDHANVKYSMGFELRPSLQIKFPGGFLVPIESIKPSGEEFYNGVMAAWKAVRV